MALHVDDVMYGGSVRFIKEVINKLVAVFEVSVQNCTNFKYVGLDIVQTSSCIQFSQNTYVQSMESVSVSNARAMRRKELLTDEERKEVKRVCGQLLWVSNNTRPEVSYETSTLCNAGKTATVMDLLRLNKLINKVKQEKGAIKYPNLGNPDKWSLAVFSDSSFANLPDGSSQGGYLVFIMAPDGKAAPLSWQSKKLHRVTKSTLSSETLAVIEAVDAALLLKKQIEEIFNVKPDVLVYTDSRSLYQTVHTSKIMADKSQRVVISYLRQYVNSGEIVIQWIDSNNQLADSLTKLGAPSHQLSEVINGGYL